MSQGLFLGCLKTDDMPFQMITRINPKPMKFECVYIKDTVESFGGFSEDVKCRNYIQFSNEDIILLVRKLTYKKDGEQKNEYHAIAEYPDKPPVIGIYTIDSLYKTYGIKMNF